MARKIYHFLIKLADFSDHFWQGGTSARRLRVETDEVADLLPNGRVVAKRIWSPNDFELPGDQHSREKSPVFGTILIIVKSQ